MMVSTRHAGSPARLLSMLGLLWGFGSLAAAASLSQTSHANDPSYCLQHNGTDVPAICLQDAHPPATISLSEFPPSCLCPTGDLSYRGPCRGCYKNMAVDGQPMKRTLTMVGSNCTAGVVYDLETPVCMAEQCTPVASSKISEVCQPLCKDSTGANVTDWVPKLGSKACDYRVGPSESFNLTQRIERLSDTQKWAVFVYTLLYNQTAAAPPILTDIPAGKTFLPLANSIDLTYEYAANIKIIDKNDVLLWPTQDWDHGIESSAPYRNVSDTPYAELANWLARLHWEIEPIGRRLWENGPTFNSTGTRFCGDEETAIVHMLYPNGTVLVLDETVQGSQSDSDPSGSDPSGSDQSDTPDPPDTSTSPGQFGHLVYDEVMGVCRKGAKLYSDQETKDVFSNLNDMTNQFENFATWSTARNADITKFQLPQANVNNRLETAWHVQGWQDTISPEIFEGVNPFSQDAMLKLAAVHAFKMPMVRGQSSRWLYENMYLQYVQERKDTNLPDLPPIKDPRTGEARPPHELWIRELFDKLVVTTMGSPSATSRWTRGRKDAQSRGLDAEFHAQLLTLPGDSDQKIIDDVEKLTTSLIPKIRGMDSLQFGNAENVPPGEEFPPIPGLPVIPEIPPGIGGSLPPLPPIPVGEELKTKRAPEGNMFNEGPYGIPPVFGELRSPGWLQFNQPGPGNARAIRWAGQSQGWQEVDMDMSSVLNTRERQEGFRLLDQGFIRASRVERASSEVGELGSIPSRARSLVKGGLIAAAIGGIALAGIFGGIFGSRHHHDDGDHNKDDEPSGVNYQTITKTQEGSTVVSTQPASTFISTSDGSTFTVTQSATTMTISQPGSTTTEVVYNTDPQGPYTTINATETPSGAANATITLAPSTITTTSLSTVFLTSTDSSLNTTITATSTDVQTITSTLTSTDTESTTVTSTSTDIEPSTTDSSPSTTITSTSTDVETMTSTSTSTDMESTTVTSTSTDVETSTTNLPPSTDTANTTITSTSTEVETMTSTSAPTVMASTTVTSTSTDIETVPVSGTTTSPVSSPSSSTLPESGTTTFPISSVSSSTVPESGTATISVSSSSSPSTVPVIGTATSPVSSLSSSTVPESGTATIPVSSSVSSSRVPESGTATIPVSSRESSSTVPESGTATSPISSSSSSTVPESGTATISVSGRESSSTVPERSSSVSSSIVPESGTTTSPMSSSVSSSIVPESGTTTSLVSSSSSSTVPESGTTSIPVGGSSSTVSESGNTTIATSDSSSSVSETGTATISMSSLSSSSSVASEIDSTTILTGGLGSSTSSETGTTTVAMGSSVISETGTATVSMSSTDSSISSETTDGSSSPDSSIYSGSTEASTLPTIYATTFVTLTSVSDSQIGAAPSSLTSTLSAPDSSYILSTTTDAQGSTSVVAIKQTQPAQPNRAGDSPHGGNGGSGLDGGQIAGLSVGLIALVAVIGMGCFWCVRRRRRAGS